ncbi:MAG TPA: hypothetical protein DCP07_08060 [Lachnospiraceae bacterium]|nr:hypothetical protein [Lachnospiraceae bacterium]
MVKIDDIFSYEDNIYEVEAYNKKAKVYWCTPISIAEDGRKFTGDSNNGINLSKKEIKVRVKQFKKELKKIKKNAKRSQD